MAMMMGNDKKPLNGPGTVVGVNVKLVGTLYDSSEIVIHGKVEGEVSSDKMITVTETAFVKGPITAETVQIAGQANGSITATGKLELLPTGKVYGSVTTKDLTVRSGAIFIGKSNMPDGDKGFETVEKENEKETKEFEA